VRRIILTRASNLVQKHSIAGFLLVHKAVAAKQTSVLLIAAVAWRLALQKPTSISCDGFLNSGGAAVEHDYRLREGFDGEAGSQVEP
jgi:hypothetical protein